MTRLRYLPFIGQFFDELYLRRHSRVMDEIRARDTTHPIILADEVLGSFSYMRSFTGGTFSLHRKWGDRNLRLDVRIHGDSPEPDMEKAAALIARARMFWQDQPGWEKRMKSCVFDEFYEVIDEDEEDETKPCMTEQEFLDSIQFDSISLSDTGKFEVWSPLAGAGDCAFVAVEGKLGEEALQAEYHG